VAATPSGATPLGAPGTVVVLSCTGNGQEGTTVTLTGHDQQTWKTTGTATFNLPAGVYLAGEDEFNTSGACGGLGGYAGQAGVLAREVLNRDLTKLAVTVSGPSGAVTVGYADTTGKVTKLGPQPSSGFADVPHAAGPIFDPTADMIWYVDQNTGHIFTQPLNSSPPTDHGEAPASMDPHWSTGVALVGTPPAPLDASNLADPNYILSPDQSMLAASRGGRLAVVALAASGTLARKGHADVFGKTQLLNPAPDPGNCPPVAWVEATTILCMGPADWSGADAAGTQNIWTVTVPRPADADNLNAVPAGHGQLILPITHLALAGAMLMPDGKTLFFVANQSGVLHAYRTSLATPGAQPTQIDDAGLLAAVAPFTPSRGADPPPAVVVR